MRDRQTERHSPPNSSQSWPALTQVVGLLWPCFSSHTGSQWQTNWQTSHQLTLTREWRFQPTANDCWTPPPLQPPAGHYNCNQVDHNQFVMPERVQRKTKSFLVKPLGLASRYERKFEIHIALVFMWFTFTLNKSFLQLTVQRASNRQQKVSLGANRSTRQLTQDRCWTNSGARRHYRLIIIVDV